MLTIDETFSEAGYYLARRKFNATLISYFAQQNSFTFQDWAIGQPHNPAYVPVMGSKPFSHPMTFKQRAISTLYLGLVLIHSIITHNYFDSALDEYLPNDQRPNRPSMSELEKEVGLALHFGDPMIMDGLRPVSPNFVMIGMLNCKPAKALPSDLKKFIEGN